MKLNELVAGDSVYTMTKAYRDGAQAMRDSVPFTCNPYRNRDSQQYYDWDDGHTNEAAGEHVRFGTDMLGAPLNGRRFEEDPAVPRDQYSSVSNDWYQAQLKSHTDTFARV
jgi:hypothetical protein